MIRDYFPGMGKAVADRTINRGGEGWGDVATRVAAGSLSVRPADGDEHTFRRHLESGSILMSGRHLQHGDPSQKDRNLELFSNCLDRSTKILTMEHGPVEIASVVGQTVTVKARDGEWRPAVVSSHGRQKLYRYTFVSRTGPNNTTHPLEVIATKNHRWFLSNGSVSEGLQPGDLLESAPFDLDQDLEAVRHGLIFGDGTSHKRRNDYHDGMACQGRDYLGIRLCGSDKNLLHLFEEYSVTYPPHAGGDPVVYVGKKRFWKALPFCVDPSYVAGFIQGWWLADGSKTYAGGDPSNRIEISTTRLDAVEWLIDHAAYAGWVVSGCSQRHRQDGDGSFPNGKTLYCVRLSRGITRRVSKVEEFGEDEVFCVEEPVTSGFVLANGLLTGNCSTSIQRSVGFYLLLNGSGVGSSADDEVCIVDFRNMPKVVCVLDEEHPDATGAFPTHACANVTFDVPDSREGWAQALELIENMSFAGDSRDKTLALDFSRVRGAGSPIAGMQGRPSSGPVPLMEAIMKIATIRDQADWAPWKQSMYFDHYAAECVLVGGARRAARIVVKSWKDPGIFEFIKIKQTGDLWSANNSIGVDAEFWAQNCEHSRAVYKAAIGAQYHHGSGEPGFLNLDMLQVGEERPTLDQVMHVSGKFELSNLGLCLRRSLARAAMAMKYFMIVNPCVTADTWVNTSEGARQVKDLIDVPFTAVVDGKPYASNGFWSTGRKPVFKVTTRRGYEVRITGNHKMLTQRGWVEASNLTSTDSLVLQRHLGNFEKNPEEFLRGWAVGHIAGDGSYNPSLYATVMNFWPQDSEDLLELAATVSGRQPTTNKAGVTKFQHRRLDKVCEGLITPLKKIPTDKLEASNPSLVAGFICGMFDSDGSVQGSIQKGRSIRLDSVNIDTLKIVQRMLSRFGVLSTIYQDRTMPGMKAMPGGTYFCQTMHTLMISRENMHRYYDQISFMDPDKRAKLEAMFDGETRVPYKDKGFSRILAVEPDGEEEVYDCTVEDVHRFDANGLTSHNCGEIRLHVSGGYCVIADVVPYHAASDSEAFDAFYQATRALLRTNMLPALYQGEVNRTNRIGVGLTGIHEYAWSRFGLGWKDLIAEGEDVMWDANGHGLRMPSARALPFWEQLTWFATAVDSACVDWCAVTGAEMPVSRRTIKPAGTTSKLFGLSEGAHLPPMREYLRWVQFKSTDPLVQEYETKGYPVRHNLRTYKGMSIVGFPTRPVICSLGMGDALVTAPEATPDEQFRFLRLLETFWLLGEGGNQVSYTLKYDPKIVDFQAYDAAIRTHMPLVRAVSIMPTVDNSHYEYLPETEVSAAEYIAIVDRIEHKMSEEIDRAHLDCSGGACPVTFFDQKAA